MITPAPAKVTAKDVSKVYGAKDPELTAEVTGLVNNETATVTATGTITEVGSTPNTYGITWGTAKADNYEITEALGMLEITKNTATVTLTAPSDSKTYDGKALTASMVNNYVKMGAVPAPRKKRYARVHLSRLIVICVLKSVLPLGDIQTLLEHGTADSSDEQFYSLFRTQYQAVREELAAVYNGSASVPSLMSAALRAQAEQQIALKFCERL